MAIWLFFRPNVFYFFFGILETAKRISSTLTTSAARNFEQKRAKFLKNPKDLHKSNFKISKDLHQRPPKGQKYLHQGSKIFVKNQLKQFFWQFFKKSPKRSQILKSPNQNSERQMVQKIAQMAPNRQIWQHCLQLWNVIFVVCCKMLNSLAYHLFEIRHWGGPKAVGRKSKNRKAKLSVRRPKTVRPKIPLGRKCIALYWRFIILVQFY